MTRIAPLEPPYDDEVADQLGQMMPPGVEPIALFRLFAKNLPMARAMHPWGAHQLGRRLALSLRDREIVIDRACARAGCEYEWGVHVDFFAEKAGLTRAQLTSLTHGSAADPVWSPRERLLVSTVDELHDTGDVSDPLWTSLAATFAEPELLDLILLAGWYRAISLIARVTRLPPEPGRPTFASYSSP